MSVLAGRRALVTGISGGLGKCVGQALKTAGCVVAGTSRNVEALTKVCDELLIHGIPADLREEADVRGLVDHAHKALGGVDILVNCAGVFPTGPIHSARLQDFDDCFAINVRAPFLLCQSLAPAMASQGWGRIVNIASSSAYSGFANTGIYCSSKHAMLGLTRSLHAELRTSNVRCFCVSPGSIQTEMGRLSPEQDFNTFIAPADIASFIVHLISYDGNMVAEETRVNRMLIQ